MGGTELIAGGSIGVLLFFLDVIDGGGCHVVH